MRLVLLEESATECNALFRLRLHTAQRYFDFRFRLQVEYVQEAASPTSSQSEEAAASRATPACTAPDGSPRPDCTESNDLSVHQRHVHLMHDARRRSRSRTLRPRECWLVAEGRADVLCVSFTPGDAGRAERVKLHARLADDPEFRKLELQDWIRAAHYKGQPTSIHIRLKEKFSQREITPSGAAEQVADQG